MTSVCSNARARHAVAARIRTKARGAALLAVVVLAACDIPTEMPILEPRFVVDADSTAFAVNQLLPSSVTVQGTNFGLSLPAANAQTSLGALCAACAALNGLTVPKPAFDGSFTTNTNLPTDVRSATVTGGTVNLLLTNNFNFDPIRPSAAARGFITIVLTSGTVTLGRDSIAGAQTSFPAGTQLNRAIQFSGAVSGPITATVRVNSPAGDPVVINTAQTFTAAATAQNVLVSNVSVNVANKQISATPVTLKFDVDETVSDHIKSGSLIVRMVNPFGVTGTLNLTFQGVNIAPKALQVAAGTTTQSIAFTGAELRQILTNNVTMNISGAVNAPAGITITPGQLISITTRIDFVVSTADQN